MSDMTRDPDQTPDAKAWPETRLETRTPDPDVAPETRPETRTLDPDIAPDTRPENWAPDPDVAPETRPENSPENWPETAPEAGLETLVDTLLHEAARAPMPKPGPKPMPKPIPDPSPDLMARVLGDALRVMPAPGGVRAPLPLWQQVVGVLGGWRAVGGLVAAAVTGLAIGLGAVDTTGVDTLWSLGYFEGYDSQAGLSAFGWDFEEG
jgi:hypothetical protein